MTFFEETFDPQTGERIETADDFPLEGPFEQAAALVSGIRVGPNHWTFTYLDGSVDHVRLVEAAR